MHSLPRLDNDRWFNINCFLKRKSPINYTAWYCVSSIERYVWYITNLRRVCRHGLISSDIRREYCQRGNWIEKLCVKILFKTRHFSVVLIIESSKWTRIELSETFAENVNFCEFTNSKLPSRKIILFIRKCARFICSKLCR